MYKSICSITLVALAAVLPGGALADSAQGGLSLRPERLQGRLSLATSTSALLRADLATPAGEPISLRGLSLMGDYYLTGALFGGERRSGGLRATSALLIGPRWQTLGAGSLGLPSSGRGLVVERRLASATPDGDANSTLPYLGIGYTGLSSQGGFSFSADLGVVALNPGSAVRFGRAFSGTQNFDGILRDLRLAPMLQLGVSYSF